MGCHHRAYILVDYLLGVALLVCTPIFAQKANVGLGGVGYEKGIVTGEIFANAASPKKFVPLLRKGDSKDCLPSYLKSRVYIDFKVTEGTKLYRDLFKRYKTWRGVRNSYVDSLLYIGGHADRALNMLLKIPERERDDVTTHLHSRME